MPMTSSPGASAIAASAMISIIPVNGTMGNPVRNGSTPETFRPIVWSRRNGWRSRSSPQRATSCLPSLSTTSTSGSLISIRTSLDEELYESADGSALADGSFTLVIGLMISECSIARKRSIVCRYDDMTWNGPLPWTAAAAAGTALVATMGAGATSGVVAAEIAGTDGRV